MVKTLGILGGGQLGRMIAEAANSIGVKTIIYSNIDNCCASQKSDKTIIADYEDFNELENFSNQCDAITFEFENIPVASVEYLEKMGNINPSSEILKITQNRILEKNFINELGVDTTDFVEIVNKEDLISGFNELGRSILKTTTLGYDGKGQFRLNELIDIENTWSDIESKSLTSNGLILEKLCHFKSEASIIVARSKSGEVRCYEPLTNIHKNGILDKSIYPARISESARQKCKDIAQKVANATKLVGLLAIEFFVMENDTIYVNEMAPRPHNSGHFSMDACETSQFKQLILAILDQKLGNVDYFTNGYMQNLIGEEIDNLSQFQINSNAKIHIYGKGKSQKGRKMGHVNIINQDQC